ncbi:S1 family peptidase [Phytoactinopolyspora halotolerans]|uniref:S1 family peptidase n=1 Tax=Phytoactinopolyspora halotolerans TaxID=1981512 RepID=A0A6L9SDY5_9ACTN|nr:S1 family peptidase [Phytoactinopolyspora halotolerans]NEE02824.1 S1 family peptidase [Phytoactinopolyspora halotolerans]
MPRTRLLTATVGVLAGCAVTASALLHPTTTQAAPSAGDSDARTMSVQRAQALVDDLSPSKTGGAYVDGDGETVITVTDRATADRVRAAGGTAQLVPHSAAQLEAIRADLNSLPPVPGTSWGVDPDTNQVAIEVYDTATGRDLRRIESIARRHGDAVRVERLSGSIEGTDFTSGGQGIQNRYGNPASTCSLGFNVQNQNGTKYFLTAGHCAANTRIWHKAANGLYLGERVGTVHFPGDDFALIGYRNSAVKAYGTVWVHGAEKQITRSRWVVDGESVDRVGTKSTDLNGIVLVPRTDVTWSDGTKMTGMIKTSLCAKSGDSGGPLFSGTYALGILSAALNPSEPCSTSRNSRTWFQPVQEVLNHYGMRVY